MKTLGRWWDYGVITAVVAVALGVAFWAYREAENNRRWEHNLKQQRVMVKDFTDQLREDNDDELESIQRIREGKGGHSIAYLITEYTGKIHAEQILFPIFDTQLAKIPDIAGLAEVEGYYQLQSRKPPKVNLQALKKVQEAMLKALPPEPVLQLESITNP